MNDVFFVPTAIATVISYLGFAFWIAAYALSWSEFIEGLSLGAAIGGLLCGAAIGFAEPPKGYEGDRP